jgi:hypothetical protein
MYRNNVQRKISTTALHIDKEHSETLRNLQGYMNSRLQYAPVSESTVQQASGNQ